MSVFDRREFLKLFTATAGCFAVAASALPFASRVAHAEAEAGRFHFPQGLASGDPQPSAVMLWTRAERVGGATKEAIDLKVQVAEDEAFTSLIVERDIRALVAADHTVRVLVSDLKPDTIYYYRFLAGGDRTPLVGRTRTAPPPGSTRRVRFAFASCQNYEQGYYGAYRRLVNDDIAAKPEDRIEFVLHLGDFIYEHTRDVPIGVTPARFVDPLPDGSAPWEPDGTHPNWQPGGQIPQTLADYRFIYKTYLSDPDLQAARARFPFIQTWDDHEFTNDAWQAHETYFGSGSPAQSRKLAANQAWFEFVPAVLSDAPDFSGVASQAKDFTPIRVATAPMGDPDDGFLFQGADNLNAIGSLTIYRAISWGAMLDLVVTDMRTYRSPPVMGKEAKSLAKGAPLPLVRIVKLLDQGRTANNGSPPEKLTYGEREIANPRRDAPAGTHLGAAQKAWFKAAMKASTARWRIWANSVPALSMRLDFSSLPFAGIEDAYVGVDAWQGYPGELNELMAFLKNEGIGNVVSCAGDYHAHIVGRLPVDPDAEALSFSAVEFATTGISSGAMFAGAYRGSKSNAFFHRMVAIEEDGKVLENFNNTLVNGVRAGMIANYTGSARVGMMFRNERASPGLSFIDSNAHGFGIATLSEDDMQVELVNVGDVTSNMGPEGAPVLRRSRFKVKSWKGGEEPVLEGPTFEGEPSFPHSHVTA